MASYRQRTKAGTWYYTYTDSNGDRIEKKGFRDKKQTERLAQEVEVRERRIKEGLITPAEAQTARWDSTPLPQQIDDWRDDLIASGNKKRYAKNKAADLKTLLGGLKRLSEITPEEVMRRLRARHDEGLAASTVRLHRSGAKHFANWLFERKRTKTNLLDSLPPFKAKEGQRRPRRALSREEFAALLAAAPPNRAMAYSLILGCALRVSEILAIGPEAFRDLEGGSPALVLAPEQDKVGRGSEIPIPRELARRLSEWLASTPLTRHGRLNWGMRARRERRMRADMNRAGIPAKTAEGSFDYHAIRTTAITWAARSTPNIKAVQKFARHQNPEITLRYYIKANEDEIRGVAESLAVPLPSRQISS